MSGSRAILGYLTRDEGMSKSKYVKALHITNATGGGRLGEQMPKSKSIEPVANQLCNVRASSPQDHVLEALHGHTTKCHENETYDILYWSALKSNVKEL